MQIGLGKKYIGSIFISAEQREQAAAVKEELLRGDNKADREEF